MKDWQLLQQWVEHRSETAFAQLVDRHIDFVHHCARRQVGDPSLAQDVTQAVFLLLSRKASAFRETVILTSWLFRTTRFVAARAQRAEYRRLRHETSSAAMQPLVESHPNNDSTFTWSELEPHLDTAIAKLPGADRDAILLRYFERKALKDVGLALGVSEEAAKKRVTRAVAKLRECLASRGISLSVLALGGFLAELRIHAAPEGLSAAITGQAIGTVASPVTLEVLVDGGARDWFWQAAQRWIPMAACVMAMLVGTAVIWNRFSSNLPETALSSSPTVEASTAGVPSPGANRTPIPTAKLASSALWVQVVDAFSGSPIAGVRTRVAFGGAAGNVPSEDRQTDATGLLQMEVHPDSFHTLSVRLASEEYVPVLLEWQDHEFVEPVLKYTCRLKRGQRVRGDVRDPSGAPVPNASVSLAGFWSHEPSQRENFGFQDSFTSVVTDALGHFEMAQVPNPLPPGGGFLVSVTHPEFIRTGVNVPAADSLATNLQLVLKPGVHLSGRILDEQGNPIDGVTVTENHRHLGPRRSTQTDAFGAFVLGPFALQSIPIELAAAGYKSYETLVALDGPIQVEWVLKRSSGPPGPVSDVHSTQVRLVGSVVDSHSGMPLPEFNVTLAQMPQEDFRRLIGVGHDGRFGWEIRLDSNQVVRLGIEADGYATLVSEEFRAETRTDPLEFRLHRVSQLRGRVLQPDGRPAAGAEVGVNGDGYGLSFEAPARLANYGPIAPYTLTDSEGRFEFPTTFLNQRMVLVVHSSGCLSVPVQGVTNALIQLERWSSIEGTLQVGGRAAANETVRIERLLLDVMAPPLGVGLDQTTDASGRFVFDRIPAGTYRVSRTLDPHPGQEGETGSSHSTRVNLTAGERTRVSLGTEGRPVVAHFRTSRVVPSLNWTQIMPRLERAPLPPEPSMDAFPNPMAFQRARALLFTSVDRYYGTVTEAGVFHADDVPAGDYVLSVTVFARSEEDGNLVAEGWPRGGILGTLKKPVTIPGVAGQRSEEPVDLGELEIVIP